MIDQLSDQALRVLAVGVRPVAELPYTEDDALTVDEKFKKCTERSRVLQYVLNTLDV